MVGVAQLVEPRIVIPVVVGSSPIVHPRFYLHTTKILRIKQLEETIWYDEGSGPAFKNAKVVELVDTLDLGSSAARRESSSLSFRTILISVLSETFIRSIYRYRD